MKFGSAQFVVLGELAILLLMESNIMSKLITITQMAYTGTQTANGTQMPTQNIYNPGSSITQQPYQGSAGKGLL